MTDTPQLILIHPGRVTPIHSEADYRQAMEAVGDRLVVVDCFAEWCPPCRQMTPIFDSLAKEYPTIVFLKVDMDKVPSLKNELSVWALPTFAFLRYGKRVGGFMGANPSLLRRGLENDGEVSLCSSISCSIQ